MARLRLCDTVSWGMIRTRGLTQTYPAAIGAAPLTVLDDVSLEVAAGEFIAVLGPSGSGKTTLLGLLAGLDFPSSGSVELDQTLLFELSEDQRAQLRAERVGFVFQNFQLLPTLTAIENGLVPLELLSDRGDYTSRRQRAESLLARVGLENRQDHYPTQLSGGEQQRVGIARAFANQPAILFADEPTGTLDRGTGSRLAALLIELNQERGTTLVVVTHDAELAAKASRIVHLDDGRIHAIETTGN